MDPVTKELIDGQAQLLADAKLGRLVRKLPLEFELYHGNEFGNGWCVINVESGESLPDGDTPEQALIAAGIKDE